jgi:hypothetical protein
LERRTGGFAHRPCARVSGAGLAVEVDCWKVAVAEVAPAWNGSSREVTTERVSEGLRRFFARLLRRDLGVPRPADVGAGSVENVIGCTRMRMRTCVCGTPVPSEYWSSHPSVAL